MTTSATLTALSNPLPPARPRPVRAAMLAHYSSPVEPPSVDEITGDEEGLIEDLYARTASAACVPPIAVREVIENLIHAGFEGATVSIYDAGASVRVSDRGPGITDKARALCPGFSTADDRVRMVVRGVGSGFTVAVGAMEAVGGSLEVEDNLNGGTVVTLRAPAGEGAGVPAELSEEARRLMALLVELAPADPGALAQELGVPLGTCGRELVLLEHRGLVSRRPDGARALTPCGSELLATLF